MRALVTGGRGFLGRAVVNDLSQHGYDVVVMSRSGTGDTSLGAPVVQADIRDRDAVRAAAAKTRPDAVVHLASLTGVRESFEQPLNYYDVNVGGLQNLLAALTHTGAVRRPVIVNGSTQAVYGEHDADTLSEQLDTRPTNPYAATKLTAEQLLDFVSRTGTVGGVSLRFVNLAGATNGIGDPERRGLIPRVLEAATSGGTVSVNGEGTAVRDYIHVTDAAAAIRLALEAAEPGSHRVYNVSTGTGSSVLDVIRTAVDVTGRRIGVSHQPPKPEPQRLVASPALIRAELGWKPEHSATTEIVQDAWGAMQRVKPARP